MLDQNTDRMWYVIGAIVIGAAIIAMGLNIFNESFDSVEDNYASVMMTANDYIDKIGPNENLIELSDLESVGSTIISEKSTVDYLTLKINPQVQSNHWWSGGLRAKSKRLDVPYGERLTVSYEIYIPNDYNNLYAANDINNFYYDKTTGTNDNDLRSDRKYNDIVSSSAHRILLTPGEWNYLSFSYINKSSDNIDELSLYDGSWFGVTNDTDSPIEVKMRKVKFEYSDSPTKFEGYRGDI